MDNEQRQFFNTCLRWSVLMENLGEPQSFPGVSQMFGKVKNRTLDLIAFQHTFELFSEIRRVQQITQELQKLL